MTKALLTAGALLALTLAMQEAVGQTVDPMAELKTVKLKERPSPKRPGEKLSAPIPANPSQPVLPQATEDVAEDIRPGFAPLAAMLANGGGTYTTSNPAGAPPASQQQHRPPPQAPHHQPSTSSARPSSLWSNLWWGFK